MTAMKPGRRSRILSRRHCRPRDLLFRFRRSIPNRTNLNLAGRRCLLQVVIEPPLLVDKSFNDPRCQWSRCLSAPSAVLHQNDHGDIRITTRSYPDKPRIGTLSTGSEALHTGTMIHHLGRSGLAGKVDVLEMRSSSRATGTVIRRKGHAIGDGLPNRRANGHVHITAPWIRLVKCLTKLGGKLIRLDDMR